MTQEKYLTKALVASIIVASLGNFVDIYDLLLFSIVRVNSLKSFGLEGAQLTESGISLLNIQMAGLLLGGILWGMLGDRKGRLYVLFGSIFIYSAANMMNAFVHSTTTYGLCRFIAGIGLAGELGAGITLVAELMPQAKRGYATTIVAATGVLGTLAAYFVADLFDWRTSFFVGGCLGFIILLLRIGVAESGIFKESKQALNRGNFFALFRNRKTFFKYLRCILIGLPFWTVAGIFMTLSPEFGKVLNVQGEVNAGASVACYSAGIVFGDMISGLLSQMLQSRIKAVYVFLTLSILSLVVFLTQNGLSLPHFYWLCGAIGVATGYWVIFITIATEQFGTNIRATVTTTVPNFVRGAVIPLSLLFQLFKTYFNGSIVSSGSVLVLISYGIAFLALMKMKDSFHKDLNYIEEFN